VTMTHATEQAALQATAPRPSDAVRLVRVVKEFGAGDQRVRAVDGVSLAIPPGQVVAIMGRSGSGKSKLVNLLAGSDQPARGEVWLEERELSRLSDDALTRLRREHLGMVYQFFNLLSTLSVRENIALPALLAGEREGEVFPRVDALLDEVGMTHRRDARPHTLSGGEMQRAALARAPVPNPPLIPAADPPGNLDSRTADQVLDLLRRLARAHGATMLIVTHSAEVAATAERLIELRDGRVIRDEVP